GYLGSQKRNHRGHPAVSLRAPPRRSFDAVEGIDAAQEEAALGDGRRRPAHLVDLVGAEQLELRARLDHEGLGVLVEAEHLAVAGPRRRREAACAREALLLVRGLARLGV